MDIRIAILTSSDRSARGERPDLSGESLRQAVLAQGWTVSNQVILPDEYDLLRQKLAAWADSGELDVILTTGGTGFAPRCDARGYSSHYRAPGAGIGRGNASSQLESDASRHAFARRLPASASAP